jgi:hypothetical protein
MIRPLDGRCQVSIYLDVNTNDRILPTPCNQPLEAGKNFCPTHEQDRIRLGGTP